MKKYLLVIFLLAICSCGDNQQGEVVKTVNDYPDLAWAYQDIKACVMQNYSGQINQALPKIVFNPTTVCQEHQSASGCTDFETIWLYQDGTVMDTKVDPTFAEESIHFMTRIGDDLHHMKLLGICSYPAWRGNW